MQQMLGMGLTTLGLLQDQQPTASEQISDLKYSDTGDQRTLSI